MFARDIGLLSREEMRALRHLAEKADWRELPGRGYLTAEVTDFWEPCARSFFILMRPKGTVHRHSDEAIKGVTHHLVLQTNRHCTNGWFEDGQDKSCHMKLGHRYIVQREPVHWAANKGKTDRIHLLVEYPEAPLMAGTNG